MAWRIQYTKTFLADISPQAHEKAWEQEPQLRSELEALRSNLEQYAEALAEIAGVTN